MQPVSSRCLPPLLVGHRSESLLRGIARAAMTRAPEVATRLLQEVDRADVVHESSVPDDVVRMGALVTYEIHPGGRTNTIRLVAPHEADVQASRISVVSDVGAALLGLRAGQQIEWRFGGRRHVLEVLHVSAEVRS
jgi:regulator of nucleoside diphosphate kinase